MNNQELTQRINEAIASSCANVLMEELAKMVGTPGWPTHRELVSIAVFCARRAHTLVKTSPNKEIINGVIETVESWLKNPSKKTREKMLNAAGAADVTECAADDLHEAFASEAACQTAYYAAEANNYNSTEGDFCEADADIAAEVVTDTIDAVEISFGVDFSGDKYEYAQATAKYVKAEHKAICDHIRQTVNIPL